MHTMGPTGTAMPPLSEQEHAEIDRLCARGDIDADRGDFPQALACYWAAWDLLPEPKIRHEAATWILAAVGDANFLGADYVAGRDNLCTVMNCPGGLGNPFLHFRLGQCHYELGQMEAAYDELSRAYHTGGAALFDDDAPKYLALLTEAAAGPAPPKKWRLWK